MGILRTNKVSGLEAPTSVTGSVSFDGSGDYLTLASSGDFAYGTGDFTWEVWVYVNSFSGNRYVLDHDSNGGTIGNGGGGNTKLHYYNATIGTGSVLYTTGFGTNLSTNTWYHLAAVRKNGTTSLYTNGVLTASASDSHNYGAQVLNIGRYGAASSGYEFNGFISNLRILKGTALYTSNFTPPVHELQPIGDTVLLCCNNPDSAGAEATGKTITVNGNAAASTFSPGLTRDFTYGTQFSGVTKFDTQGYFVPPSGTTEQRGRGRGVFGGGYIAPANVNTIDFINIQSTGNAIDFGDTSTSASNGSALGSSTRGVIGGYNTPSTVNTIEYITFATTSNSLDFGDLTLSRWGTASASSRTRGIFYSGYVAPANVNNIDYITIASVGNAIDFGDAITSTRSGDGCSSSTRGLFAGGVSPSLNTIEYITIATTGNSQDFGDLTVSRFGAAATSSSTRAIFCGGYVGPAGQLTNTIDYVTMSSIGNAIDFGDLTRSNWTLKGLSNSIRGIIGGGYVAPSYNNNIDYVTIASTGNASDFGDMTSSRGSYSACSDSHGGLS
jgi:hypothetical protein